MKYLEEFKKKVVDEYLSGKSSTDVADEYGVWGTTVLNWVREFGYEVRKQGQIYSQKYREEVVKAYSECESCKKVAEEYDISTHTVLRWIRESDTDVEISRGHSVDYYDKNFKEKVVDEYLDGKSSLDLSKEYNISPNTILDWVRKFGYGDCIDNPRYDEDEKVKVVKEYLDGISVAKLSDMYNIEQKAIRRWIANRLVVR